MKMVLAHGNAPSSIGYQPIALLLSYTRESWRRAEDSALQVRRAAIGTTAPKWTRRRDLHPRSSALQAGPLAARARREKIKPRLRSLGVRRLLSRPSSVTAD